LTQRGLVAALQMHVLKSGINACVAIEGDETSRFPAEVEAALYFCAVEALQNTSKHAPRSDVTVGLRLHPAGADMEIADTGPGFDLREVNAGSGLQNMTDRIEAIGGRLKIRTAPGAGTSVAAYVGAPATGGMAILSGQRADVSAQGVQSSDAVGA
jgi:signal transduction histidine kinase